MDEEIRELLADYDAFIRAGRTPEDARSRLLRLGEPQQVEEAIRQYQRECRQFIELRDPCVLDGDQHVESWYRGPDFAGARHWPAYRQVLEEKGYGNAIESIDRASTGIIARMPHPGTGVFSHKGLVVGYVQSGKTANYTAVISKAADAGFRLFIVLAGMTSSLRRQTQKRLYKELCSKVPEQWDTLTDIDRDFYAGARQPDAILGGGTRRPRVLAVVKKNTHILQRLVGFLQDAAPHVLANCPTLIIDDEADQASVNTARRAARRTAINRRIIEIIGTLPKACYVGYTATPFANVFIDPALDEDLYPRHFIVSLDSPARYIGAESIFGRAAIRGEDDGDAPDGLDVVREVEDPCDVESLQPPSRDGRFEFNPTMTESLSSAVQYFFLATAARYARAQDQHSSMLVHTTMYTDTHEKLQRILDAERARICSLIEEGDPGFFAQLQGQWEDEHQRVEKDRFAPPPPTTAWGDVLAQLPLVAERAEVVIDNGRLGTGLEYPDLDEPGAGPPKVFIAVGGNTLSRGLTLEGLVVSYFMRQAAAYDTLLQMGRWFGFRRGYEDLPRLWLTDDLLADFHHLATVEAEIRRDIERYRLEQRTPLNWAVRVRSHPRLAPTSRMKMQNTRIAAASYGNQREQTTRFKHRDTAWLRGNIEAGRALVRAAQAAGSIVPNVAQGKTVFSGVPVEHIESFLWDYQVSDAHQDLRSDLILRYIRMENRRGSLQTWSVAVMGRDQVGRVRSTWSGNEHSLGSMDLGLPEPVPCINRSRYTTVEPAYLKAVTSRPDRIIDIEGDFNRSMNEDAMIALRAEHRPTEGLLLLYPVSKDSVPVRTGRDPDPRRRDLDAEEHILALALVFPPSQIEDAEYISNDLSAVFGGSADFDLDDEFDAPEPDEGEELEG